MVFYKRKTKGYNKKWEFIGKEKSHKWGKFIVKAVDKNRAGRLKDKNCKISYNYNKQRRDRHEDVNSKCGGGSTKCRSFRI